MLEVLAFVRTLLSDAAKEIAALLPNKSPMEVEDEEEAQGKEEWEGSFSSFSTSLCSLDVSDVGLEDAMVEAREDGEDVEGQVEVLGKEEKG